MSVANCNLCYETTDYTEDYFKSLTSDDCEKTSSECYKEEKCPSKTNGNCTFDMNLPCCQCKIAHCLK